MDLSFKNCKRMVKYKLKISFFAIFSGQNCRHSLELWPTSGLGANATCFSASFNVACLRAQNRFERMCSGVGGWHSKVIAVFWEIRRRRRRLVVLETLRRDLLDPARDQVVGKVSLEWVYYFGQLASQREESRLHLWQSANWLRHFARGANSAKQPLARWHKLSVTCGR